MFSNSFNIFFSDNIKELYYYYNSSLNFFRETSKAPYFISGYEKLKFWADRRSFNQIADLYYFFWFKLGAYGLKNKRFKALARFLKIYMLERLNKCTI